jgi:hypothetical protein
MYIRKTRDEWQIHANYGQGYEHECSYDKFKEARDDIKAYRENRPEYQYKLVSRRAPIK